MGRREDRPFFEGGALDPEDPRPAACFGARVFTFHFPPAGRVATCTTAPKASSGSLTQAPIASPLDVIASSGSAKAPGVANRPAPFHGPFFGRLDTSIADSSS
jgi:hypothetical protein